MRRGTGFAFLFLFSLTAAAPQIPTDQPAPALPFFDWKACPFEGCMYGNWVALKPTSAYTSWKADRQPLTQVSAGDTVTALSGVVITNIPGTIRMDRDLPAENLKQGDTILTYAYRGEGFSAVWFKDKYYAEFDISFTRWPDGQGCGGSHCAATYLDPGKKDWWAEVKLQSGQTAWIDLKDSFDFAIK
jgi:hypothetical protein